jgi:hypothetical protein
LGLFEKGLKHGPTYKFNGLNKIIPLQKNNSNFTKPIEKHSLLS